MQPTFIMGQNRGMNPTYGQRSKTSGTALETATLPRSSHSRRRHSLLLANVTCT